MPPQLSVAVAEPEARPIHAIVIFAGQVITGGIRSPVVIVCTQVLVFPAASVAVQVRVMMFPIVTSEEVTTTVSTQLSVAVAEPVAAGAVDPPQVTVAFAGQVIVGFVTSLIITF